jgi:hypothetical protein
VHFYRRGTRAVNASAILNSLLGALSCRFLIRGEPPLAEARSPRRIKTPLNRLQGRRYANGEPDERASAILNSQLIYPFLEICR